MYKMINNKYLILIALITSFFVLVLFLLLGLILVIFFLQNLLIGISGLGLTQILYAWIGMYLFYRSSNNIILLAKNRNNFNKIFNDFTDKNKKTILIAAVLSIILLSLFYSNVSSSFYFFINVILYLPIFVLENLTFIANIFLLRYNLTFLAPLIDLVLPISEVLFLYTISGYIAKFLNKNNSNF